MSQGIKVDYLSKCLAMVLDVPETSVPNFTALSSVGEPYEGIVKGFLKGHGYTVKPEPMVKLASKGELPKDLYVVMGACSKGKNHYVVCRDGKVYKDFDENNKSFVPDLVLVLSKIEEDVSVPSQVGNEVAPEPQEPISQDSQETEVEGSVDESQEESPKD